MKANGLPEKFTRIGFGPDGKEYIQCTRTGDVLVQAGDADWVHFASADEWRSKTAAQLYPQLIHLNRALKQVGEHEDATRQVRVLQEAIALLDELRGTVRQRIGQLETGPA
jgi:hypothetical protein